MVRYCNVSSFHTVTIYNYSYPLSLPQPVKHEVYGNKKGMGDSNFSPIPDLRPSHCLYARISNEASPRQ